MDAGQLQSKKPRSLLAGSYGHPVHPLMVTVPIGAWCVPSSSTSSRTGARTRSRGAAARCG